MQSKPSPHVSLSRGKRWLFGLGAGLLPIVALLILEGLLRLTGYGDYPSLFTPISGYEAYLQPNDRVAERYFTTIESIPGIPFDSFRASKPDSALRVVVQGGSTAAGFPFYFGGSFPDMLEQRLLMTFPGRQIEVINTAMAAVNSYTLLDLADEIIAQEPDVIIIYAGHNEYYGALGVGSTQLLGRNPALIRLYLSLKPWRTTQLLQDLIQQVIAAFGSTPSEEPGGATLMQNMVGEQRIPLGSRLYEEGIAQFKSNMDKLLSKYSKAGIPVLLGTIVSNERDHAPFLSGVSDDQTIAGARNGVEEALTLAASGQDAMAMERISDTIERYPEYAAGWYARARLFDDSGDPVSAARDYREARLRDELRFRGPDRMNEVLRDVGQHHNGIIVDTEAAIRLASPDGIPGREMMLEHLHPTIDGYFVLSDAFYEALVALGPGTQAGFDWSRTVSRDAARRSLLVTPIDSLVGRYRVDQLMSSWPFKQPRYVRSSMDTLAAGTLAGELALQVYTRERTRVQALDQFQQAAASVGNARLALQSIFAIIQRYPFLPGPYLSAANIQMSLRDYAQAEQYVLASLERAESAEGLRILGSLLLNRGRPQDAIAPLQRAVQLDALDAIAHYNLAGAYALTGRLDDARRSGHRAQELAPDNPDIPRFLNSLPE